jgi:hypothetical protein
VSLPCLTLTHHPVCCRVYLPRSSTRTCRFWKTRSSTCHDFLTHGLGLIYGCELVEVVVVSRWSWVVGRGSWVVGRGSWVVGRGSWVVGRGSWVVGRWSWSLWLSFAFCLSCAGICLSPGVVFVLGLSCLVLSFLPRSYFCLSMLYCRKQ